MTRKSWAAVSIVAVVGICAYTLPLVAGTEVQRATTETNVTATAPGNFGWTVASGFVGALLALVLKHLYDRWQARKTRCRRAKSLRAEINYSARLARTYMTEGYTAPLYRFPNAVFNSMYPHLLSDTLIEVDIEALTGFFSLVDQMNRGLDAVERYRAADDQEHANEEINRLMEKAAQMAHPTEASRAPGEYLNYYAGAIAAVNRHAECRFSSLLLTGSATGRRSLYDLCVNRAVRTA